jgi:hypothetical protein
MLGLGWWVRRIPQAVRVRCFSRAHSAVSRMLLNDSATEGVKFVAR